jgi:tryptophan synthase beta chain
MSELLDRDAREALLVAELRGELPDARGRFGPFGGRYVPETLVPAFERLEAGVRDHLHEASFQEEFRRELREWVGRPTALTHAARLSKAWGADVWLKREDLAHTGAHKINNAIGQAILAKRLGAKRIIAETGAGQHGVASAAACARVGLPCTVYMGAVDIEALRTWVTDPAGIYYLLGSAVGAHPYPYLVRELQSVIGEEARQQMLDQAGGLPDVAFACVGGGSNAIGLFYPLRGDDIELIGVEAGGTGNGLGQNAATLATGTPGVLQGSYTMILQDDDGQVQETHSISAGLDYSGVGPEHALLQATGRVTYISATDDEALEALEELCAAEGILTALETSHAFAAARVYAQRHPGARILIGNSGRGDKDMPTLTKYPARIRTHETA